MNLSFKEDIAKSDNNIKALWDSFTLFTTSIHTKQIINQFQKLTKELLIALLLQILGLLKKNKLNKIKKIFNYFPQGFLIFKIFKI